MNNNENNFFSEKVNLVFNEFLKNEEANKRMMTEARLKILVEHLNNIAHTDEEKIAVIKQAIEGNFSMFHSLPKGQSINNDNTSTFTDYIHAPSEEEFIKYFEENSRSKELAKKVYDDFAYNKKWKDKAGFSIKENWKEILKQYDFYDNK